MATREEDATGREAVSAFAKIRSDTHWRLGAVGAQAVSGTLEWSWTVSFLFVHNERLHKRYQQRRNIHIRLNPPLARCTRESLRRRSVLRRLSYKVPPPFAPMLHSNAPLRPKYGGDATIESAAQRRAYKFS